MKNLNDAIRKKEKKISDYQKQSGTNEQWLLIVIGGIGDSSFLIDSIDTLQNVKGTAFDKVYLLEDYLANLYEVK